MEAFGNYEDILPIAKKYEAHLIVNDPCPLEKDVTNSIIEPFASRLNREKKPTRLNPVESESTFIMQQQVF